MMKKMSTNLVEISWVREGGDMRCGGLCLWLVEETD